MRLLILFQFWQNFKYNKHVSEVRALVCLFLTVRCLVCEKCCQFLVLLLLWQKWNRQVGPHSHFVILLLLLSQNLLLSLNTKMKKKKWSSFLNESVQQNLSVPRRAE